MNSLFCGDQKSLCAAVSVGAMSGRASDADDYLEDYYDAIVLSTGLGSSILAA